MTMQILQPPGWARPKGFSNGISCQGRLVFIGGQIGWSGQGEWLDRSFAGQFRQALKISWKSWRRPAASPSTSCG